MRCDQCKYSKVKSNVERDSTISFQRFCMHSLPTVTLMQSPQGVMPIVARAPVDDDDFCSKFEEAPKVEHKSTTVLSS